MDLTAFRALIGKLTNDPNHDRYLVEDIDVELDNTQDEWNVEAKIIKDTVTITVVAGTRQYALSGFTGTPISFPRATHKGLDLEKVDKTYMDLYSGEDWTLIVGTPRKFYIEATDPDVQMFTIYPTPQAEDAGANLVSEYVKRHTPMTAGSDLPFNALPLLVPYHYGLAYDVAQRLLLRDPTPDNSNKIFGADGRSGYKGEAAIAKANVIQVFKALEKQEPPRLRGGRRWR